MALLFMLNEQEEASGYPLLPYITADAVVFDGQYSELFEDSGLETPMAWGGAQPLGGVSDLLGSGIVLRQTTSNARPRAQKDAEGMQWFEDGNEVNFRCLDSQIDVSGPFTLACVYMQRAAWGGGGQPPSVVGSHAVWDSEALWLYMDDAAGTAAHVDINASTMNGGATTANYTAKGAIILRRASDGTVRLYAKADATAALPWAVDATDTKAGDNADTVKTALDFYGDRIKKAFWFYMAADISDDGLAVLQQRMREIALAWGGTPL